MIYYYIFYGGSVMDNEKKENKVIKWVKAYKKQILTTALVTGGAALTIVVLRNLLNLKMVIIRSIGFEEMIRQKHKLKCLIALITL